MGVWGRRAVHACVSVFCYRMLTASLASGWQALIGTFRTSSAAVCAFAMLEVAPERMGGVCALPPTSAGGAASVHTSMSLRHAVNTRRAREPFTCACRSWWVLSGACSGMRRQLYMRGLPLRMERSPPDSLLWRYPDFVLP